MLYFHGINIVTYRPTIGFAGHLGIIIWQVRVMELFQGITVTQQFILY